MKVSFEEIEEGDKFLSDDDGLIRVFTKKNSSIALDEDGDEWLIMNVVDEFYEVINENS